MNLRGLDLNLLVLLHALLEERHVSRAARRAGLSQPAMSNALDRCRRLFGDPLLERAGREMRPTARGEALRGPLAAALAELGALVDAAPPALATIRRTVGIVLADALAAALAGPLLARTGAEAPEVTLAFHGWAGGAAALERVRTGAADLAVSVLPPPPADVRQEALVEERYVLAGAAGHPALADGGGRLWLDFGHVVVSAEGAVATPLDDRLAAAGLSRRVAVAVPSFLLVPDLLRGSDLLALAPSLALAGGRGAGLDVRPPPVAVDGFRLGMAWHRRSEGDVAVRFVADAARDLLRALRGAADAAGPMKV